MKKFNLNSNKTKLTARVMLIVLLLASAVNLAGCTSGYKYYRYQEIDAINRRPMTFRAKSITNIFDLENINLDLEFGIHKLSFLGQMDENPKEQYPYRNYNIGFSIYICDGEYIVDFPDSLTRLDKVENHFFVREIKEDEAFTKEYGYSVFGCNHIETINIPSAFFDKNEGSVIVKLVIYFQSRDLIYNFLAKNWICPIKLEYEKTENNKVIITNFYEY